MVDLPVVETLHEADIRIAVEPLCPGELVPIACEKVRYIDNLLNIESLLKLTFKPDMMLLRHVTINSWVSNTSQESSTGNDGRVKIFVLQAWKSDLGNGIVVVQFL